jgi:hypothetical protein
MLGLGRFRQIYQNYLTRRFVKNRTKYFCIGRNKTGTTSLKVAFQELGFIVGNQRQAELLANDYFNGNFQPIISYCNKAEVFQDVPFSWPDTYKILDKAYPNSKFILSVRDSSEQWYQSMINFQSKLFGKGTLPSLKDLKEVDYVYKGWSWNNKVKMFGLKEDDNPYDKEMLINHYEKHNNDVKTYFKDRPNDLLVINVSEIGAYQKLCSFIGISSENKDFPWVNKTENIKIRQ